MKERFDELVINGNFFAKGKVSCRRLEVHGNMCIDGGQLYCQELYVHGSVYVRGNVYLDCEEVSIPANCKVVVEGDFFCDGPVVAHGGEITINGEFTATSMVKLGYTRLKVGEYIHMQYLYCGELVAGGNVNIEYGILDAKGRIFCLGDVYALKITTNHNSIYCGGKVYANRYNMGDVHEDIKAWKNLN